MVKRTIPVVDLSKFTDGTAAEKKAFVKKLGDAFHEIGFAWSKEPRRFPAID